MESVKRYVKRHKYNLTHIKNTSQCVCLCVSQCVHMYIRNLTHVIKYNTMYLFICINSVPHFTGVRRCCAVTMGSVGRGRAVCSRGGGVNDLM